LLIYVEYNTECAEALRTVIGLPDVILDQVNGFVVRNQMASEVQQKITPRSLKMNADGLRITVEELLNWYK
jgi:hypothetical protein